LPNRNGFFCRVLPAAVCGTIVEMSFEIRNPTSQDLDALETLLNASFQYDANESYCVDFAPLFSNTTLESSRIITKNGTIAASGALHVSRVKVGSESFKAGIIGAIATAPQHRNAGLASQVLAELEGLALRHNCETLVLWSDQVAFYEKLGFKAAGTQEIYLLTELFAAINEKNLDRILNETKGSAAYGWNEEVKALYQNHVFRCERTPEYWAELEKIRTCTRLQWLNEQGEATAYLAYNRGKDLKGVVHEWGGEGNALTKLAAVAASKNSDLTWLTHPGLADPIMGLAENRTSLKPLMQSHLALFKPLTSRVIDYSKFWFWGLDSL